MMQNDSLKKLSVFMMLTLVGCGSSTGTSSEPAPQNYDRLATATPLKLSSETLIGTWVSACHEDPNRNRIYIIETLEMNDGGIKRTTLSSLDPSCFQQLYEQEFNGNYLFSASGHYSERRIKMAMKPLSPFSVSLFSRDQGLCSIKDWKLNEWLETKDIKECGYEPVLNANLGLYQSGSSITLRFGNCHEECSTTEFQKSK